MSSITGPAGFPSNNIEMKADCTRISVNPNGAFVETFSIAGRDILFPRQQIGKKDRGGAFFSFPNAGPDISGGLPQHGFARLSEWEVIESSENKVVLALSTAGEYESEYPYFFNAQISYLVRSRGMTAMLEVENLGFEPIPVAAGFHPYFACDLSSDEAVQIQTKAFTMQPVDPTVAQVIPPSWTEDGEVNTAILLGGGQHVKVIAYQMPNFVVWSDQRGGYLCLEPFTSGLDGLRRNPIFVPTKSETSNGKLMQYVTIDYLVF